MFRQRTSSHFLGSLLVIALISTTMISSAQENPYMITIMHTNDTRANHLPNGDDVGGAARQATMVRDIRDSVDNSLLLDAGGRFTGTLFHRVYAGQDNVQVMNTLGYDAMTVGNPEFDNGDDILAQFIDGLTFPVVAANIDASRSPSLANKFQPYLVTEVGGEAIGIIGITTDTIPRISSPSANITFASNMQQVIQEQADFLTSEGVNKIILLSYLGYDLDVEIAPLLSGVDLIVGGNTRTLLSNTAADSAGPYPTVLQSADGAPILIVQSGGGSRGELIYMGRIDLTFDNTGLLTVWEGDTILLDSNIAQDPEMEILIDTLNEEVQIERQRVIRTPGGDVVTVANSFNIDDCRIRECALGNLVANAIRWQTGSQIALTNGGGMRGGIEAGDLLRGEILEFLPFTNRLTTFRALGADIVVALENGVSRVGESSGTGRFPQISGTRFTYDVSQAPFSRIVSVEVLAGDGITYEPIDPTATYSIVTTDFIRKGGDGYQVFADRGRDAADTLIFLDDVFQSYVREHSPLDPQLEGRITVLNLP